MIGRAVGGGIIAAGGIWDGMSYDWPGVVLGIVVMGLGAVIVGIAK